jgi:hypothetical protein
MLGDTAVQDAVRDRHEIEDRMSSLVGHLVSSDPSEDSHVRLHSRALDLAWVLWPGVEFEEQRERLDRLIAARRK